MRRKPIYIVRMIAQGVAVVGQVTITPSGYVTDVVARRRLVAAFVKQLRSIGLEVTPKQPEAHR